MYLIFFTKEGLLMISEIETTTDPVLSREDAIAILNTPDEELDQLIAQAEKLRRKYKGNHVSIHILTNARSGKNMNTNMIALIFSAQFFSLCNELIEFFVRCIQDCNRIFS